jgi:hypothetical protein
MDNTYSTRTDDIIKTVAYFDVFKYPLTDEQIYRYLPRDEVTRQDASTMVKELVSAGVLQEYNNYYFLDSEDNIIVSKRTDDEHRAKRMMKAARLVSLLLKQFPFTRAVFVTGSLSKNVAAEDSDIDFMIVTAKDRLWICKTAMTLFRKIFLLGSHKYFCTNYFVAENDVAVPDHNIYAALEVLTTRVMWNVPAFWNFQQRNSWAREYLPHCTPSADPMAVLAGSRSGLQRAIEGVLALLPLTTINDYLMRRFKHHWEKAYPDLPEDQREASFHTSPTMATVWKTNYYSVILNHYRNKLSELGLEELYD